jgi:serine/threonine-protein kinase PpkA
MKMTSVGAVLGTPHYMSPEQAQGKSIDGRTDIYSLGVVFFEILSGQVPFNGDDALAVAVKHMTSTVPKLPRQYKKYQSIIEKMMAKKPSDRYQTGDELIIALDKLSESLSSQPTSLNTHTGSTTVQVVNVISTLLIALWSAINISFKRLMLTKIQFSSTTTQLSNKQLEDLDKFIFDNDYSQLPDELSDVALIQDTIEQPALRLQPLKLILPICLIGLIAIGITFFIQDKEEINPSPLLEISHELTTQPEPVLQEKTKNEPVLLESVTKFSEETIDENEIKIADVEKPTVVKKSSYPLTISTNPTNAQVRILNIKPRYKDGIKLTSGAYHIEVQAENYLPETIWLRIKNKALNKHIKLTPTRRLLATGSITRDKTIDGDQGPQMVVLPQNPLLLEDSKKELSPIKPIAISQKEITFEEYDNFAIKTGRQLPDDFGWGRGNRPVIGITYHDAQAYAKWLSEQTQQVYRLPTLIEWEYAYRGGETSQYWWGDKQEENRANCKKGCRSKFSKLFRSTTAPTASFDANPYGLYDIAGNAAEWIDACQVWKDQEKNQCETTLIAGGSHKDKASNIKANSVVAIDAESRSKSVGLRLLLEL